VTVPGFLGFEEIATLQQIRKTMNRKSILLLPALMMTAASLAKGQTYSGAVLYPVTLPILDVPGGVVFDVSAGQAVGVGSPLSNHAYLWTTVGALDLNPSGFAESEALGTNGTQQVGYASGSGGTVDEHALLWNGTAASAVDLSPTNLSGIYDSLAVATSGTQQVGMGDGATDGSHALLWTGTAASAVDLNPTNLSGITSSEALGTDGAQQVGYGGPFFGTHALLWTGTAASAVDLNPSGFADSIAYGINGTQQTGGGKPSILSGSHALLWTGTAASAVDLNPTNFSGIDDSVAYATNGIQQVGYGEGSGTGLEPFGDGYYPNALVWTGTAGSAVNLQRLLPATGTWNGSTAYSVDASGDVFGTADGTFNDVTATFVVEWSPVPEPAASSLLLIVGGGMLTRRRRKLVA
jgi:hypothetical protein